MISNEENVINMYGKMKHDGWDSSSPLKWGFFFVSDREDNLKSIYSELADHSYNVENIYQADEKKWVLQVSKVETLAPDKLHRRNIAFNDLADAYESIYDGWDVGKCH